MKITVRLVSIGGSHIGGERVHEVCDGFRLGDIPTLVGLENEDSLAMLVNNMPVPPTGRDAHVLHDNDLVTVFPPIRGG